MRRVGVHTSISGGLYMSLNRAHALSCSTVQIFSHNPREWALKEIPEKDSSLFKRLRSELDITPVYVHTSYLINMASPMESLWGKSIALLKEEMNRADVINADFVILHTGSASGEDKKTARLRAIKGLKAVFKNSRWNAGLLLENTAGEKGDITSEIKGLGEIMDNLNSFISGICIDTCHAFASGYDIRRDDGIDRFSQEIEKYIGVNKLRLIHLNDSKSGLGLHRDRHEHIGCGKIGRKGLKKFITHKRFAHIPIILETPRKTDSDDVRNLKKVQVMLR